MDKMELNLNEMENITGGAAGSEAPLTPKAGCDVYRIVGNDNLTKIAKKFNNLGFSILATGKTYDMIAEAGIPAEKIKKLYEGRPNITDAMTNGKIDLIINTPAGADSRHDDSYIRKAAIKYRIPYITTMAAASATAEGIAAITSQGGTLSVKSLQEFHSEITE